MATENYTQLIANLKSLRLSAMAEMLDSYAKQAAGANMSYLDFLAGLVTEEVNFKQRRGVENRIKSAKFPILKRLSNFEYAFQPSISQKKVETLASLRFIDHQENVLLLGPPGVGKTHLAIGLGVLACEAGYRVLFTTLNEMVSALMASIADNSLASKLRSFVQPALLIIDEVGYLPVSTEGAHSLFQVIAKRYETGSIILTSDKSFADWGAVLGDGVLASAILDRLLHHSTIFNIRGKSFRLREKQRAIDQQTASPSESFQAEA